MPGGPEPTHARVQSSSSRKGRVCRSLAECEAPLPSGELALRTHGDRGASEPKVLSYAAHGPCPVLLAWLRWTEPAGLEGDAGPQPGPCWCGPVVALMPTLGLKQPGLGQEPFMQTSESQAQRGAERPRCLASACVLDAGKHQGAGRGEPLVGWLSEAQRAAPGQGWQERKMPLTSP